MNNHIAYLGLGSNLGDSLSLMRRARQAVQQSPGIQRTAASALYRTAPVGGPPDQPDYLNGVIEIVTSLDPDTLLLCCQAIETLYGRERQTRWAARTLDIDLLLYEEQIIDSDTLQLPHPRMAERGFVLRPLCDLAPDLVHPQLGRSMADLLAKISPLEGVHRCDEVW